jgi:hypothetical protein
MTGTELVLGSHANPLAHLKGIVPKISNAGDEYEFAAGINTMTKKLGWRPKAIPSFDPVDALTTVHDIFEHFPKTQVSGIADELLAQGAMLWLRLEGGYFGEFNNHNFDLESMLTKQVPGAWGMLFATAIARRMELEKAPVMGESAEPLPLRTEGVLNHIITRADSLIGKTGIWGSFESRLANLDLAQRTMLQRSVLGAAPWIRLGYRLAAKRYEGLEKRRLVRLFNQTISEVNEILHLEGVMRQGRGDSGKCGMKLMVDPQNYRSVVTMCVETMAPELSQAEQDEINRAQDDELHGTFS